MKQAIDSLKRLDVSWHPIDRKALRVLSESDYDFLVTEPTSVYLNNVLSAVYLPNGIWSDDDIGDLMDALENLQFTFEPYGRVASGGQAGGLSTHSKSFGWMPRRAMRNDFCHIAVMANSNPELHKRLCELGKYASDIYAEYVPDVWQAHKEKVTNTINPKHLVSGVYTGGIVNKNSALGGHVDGGNVTGTWNSQMTIKKDIQGGYLVLPELRIAFEVANGSMSLFEAQKLWHGVTPVIKTRKNSIRYSVVWFSLAMLKHCLEPQEELLRIQRKKTEREWKRAGIGT